MLCSTVKNKVFDTCGIKNFIVGSRIPTKGISKKRFLKKRESPVLGNHVIILWKIITPTGLKKVDSLFGVDYGGYAKALLRLLEIRITHSRHVESVMLLERKG